jgi:hypothetical protein
MADRRRMGAGLGLTQEQAEVLAIVISDVTATRRRIEEVRGVARLSIGPDGPMSLPQDSSGGATGPLRPTRPDSCLCYRYQQHRPSVRRPTRKFRYFGVATRPLLGGVSLSLGRPVVLGGEVRESGRGDELRMTI